MSVRFDPIREWKVDGREWAALHPLVHAMREHGWIRAGKAGMLDTATRLVELRNGERALPPALVDRALELAAEQRRNGCPVSDAELLEELLDLVPRR